MTENLPRLLMVDDEPAVIMALARRLHREYTIFSAGDGVAALKLLAEERPIHIIVTDMRMPLMHGAALLQQTAQLYPDMLRILLTGQADLPTAIAAINEGQIFRFLVKPCAIDVLRVQLKAAMRQSDLVSAERVLLEQTLRGAIQTLTEVLAFAMPEAFGKATRIRQGAQLLLKAVGVAESWRVEMAATLSQVGAVTLSQATAVKLYRGQRLTTDEQTAVDALPTIAVDMLKRIPRLESVCELIALAFGPARAGAVLTLEAQALRLAAEYELLHARGMAGDELAEQLQRGGYDISLLNAFVRTLNATGSAARVADVSFEQLRDGMVLAEDVYGTNGILIMARGFVVKSSLTARLRGLRATLGARETLRVVMAE